MTFGFTIKWGDQQFTVSGYPTPSEAKEACMMWAVKNGWTSPKWWEFWRWGDTRASFE